MMIALSGTPGTGKTSVSDYLSKTGINIIRVIDTIKPYCLGPDPERDTEIIDDEQWVAHFPPVQGVVEGHLSHLLPADRVIILRCRPDILEQRLMKRGYAYEKIQENVEAELLDVILVEALEIHGSNKIYEIDTTDEDIATIAKRAEDVIKGTATPSVGIVDWLSICGDMR